MASYLEELTTRLTAGLAGLPQAARAKHARYLKAVQRQDGGFAGRGGGSDLYYTSFGLRGLAILGKLPGRPAARAATFLKGRLAGRESTVDFLSLIYSAWLLRVSAGIDVFADAWPEWRKAVAESLQQLRRDDGGYAKGPEGRASSTYYTFLVLLCLELIGAPVRDPEGIVRFLRCQQSDDGGFREIRASKRAGTNPTAAAVGALRMLGALDEPTREGTIRFLKQMQTAEGGLRANTRIPIADVLSTFSGAMTLADLNALEEIDLRQVKEFVGSLQLEGGGFHAAAWDLACDVEYTFYGLGCLALLSRQMGNRG